MFAEIIPQYEKKKNADIVARVFCFYLSEKLCGK